MKLKRDELKEHLTNLRDRIPLPNNNCKSDDLTFLSLLYLIIMQTFGTILLFLYTLINFCTIILSVVKFFLGWLINLLQTSSKSSMLIKSAVILVEFLVLMLIVYKIASIVFVPIIGMQLTVANQIVGRDTSEKKGAWFMGGDTRKDASAGDDETKSESMKDRPKKTAHEQDNILDQNRFSKEEDKVKENTVIDQVVEEHFYSEHNLHDNGLIKINCGAEAFNRTHIKRKVIIFKEGMNINDVRLLCNS